MSHVDLGWLVVNRDLALPGVRSVCDLLRLSAPSHAFSAHTVFDLREAFEVLPLLSAFDGGTYRAVAFAAVHDPRRIRMASGEDVFSMRVKRGRQTYFDVVFVIYCRSRDLVEAFFNILN